MASVFLSYDHDDAAKARSIALALEKAGHSVWWDLHVRSGAQFSKVIEQSLNAADVVVVLWSAHAVESAWVRDEAAAGRDTGRLVPATLDGTLPPLGFRQFQTVDFSRWKGRGKPTELRTLLADIAEISKGEDGAADHQAIPGSVARHHIRTSYLRIGLAVAGVLALLAAGIFYSVVPAKPSDVTTVVVEAAAPSAKGLAQDLLVDLGNLRPVQEGSVQLLGSADKQGSALAIKVSGVSSGTGETNVVLTKGKGGSILWSKKFELGSGSVADLKQRLAYTAGRVLTCAMEGLQLEGNSLGSETLKLYLGGCSQFAEGSDETRISAIPIFNRVVKDAPRFTAGWAKLLLAEDDAVASDSTRDRRNLRQYIASARALDPHMPEATVAEVTLLPARDFEGALRLLDQAVAGHPGNALILGTRSIALAKVGRMTEAVADSKEAARLDPTSPDALTNFVLTLAYSGRLDAAREELQRTERLWAGTGRLQELQYAFQLRFGDPKEMLKTDRYREANTRMQLYYQTRADPTRANIDRFMAFLAGLYSRRGLTASDIIGHSQVYGELQREDNLYALIFRLPPGEDLSQLAGVVFRPSLRKFRHDPRFMIVAKRIGLVDYWTKSGKWPDFCFDPDQPYDCKAEAAKLGA